LRQKALDKYQLKQGMKAMLAKAKQEEFEGSEAA
jgi:hypothetical protein